MSAKLQSVNWGGLEGLYVKGQANGPLIVMIHGYGASQFDLVGLADGLSRQQELSWYFPNGLFEVPIGPHMTGRGWFSISYDEVDAAIRSNTAISSLQNGRPKGFDKSLNALLKALAESGHAPETMVLCGFSQGSMMALELATTLPEKPLGAVLFSSALFDHGGLKKRLTRLKDFKVLQTHGRQDQVLSEGGALMLKDLMEAHHLNVEFISFNGGHAIPLNVVQRFEGFIRELQMG